MRRATSISGTALLGFNLGTADFTANLLPANDRFGEQSTYEVILNGVGIGRVFRRNFTREIKPRNSRIVTKRWQSLGWTYESKTNLGRRHFEVYTRTDAVEKLVADHLRKVAQES